MGSEFKSIEDAVAFAETEWWESVPLVDAARYQLNEDKLVMPFDKFHRGIEKMLGRPVFTHEFAGVERLRAEAASMRDAPSLAEVLAMIPEEKRVVVITNA